MVLSKELRPVQSKKLYEEKSKEMLKNVSIGAGECVSTQMRSCLKFAVRFILQYFFSDVPELKQAVSAQLIASLHPYKKDYKEQIVGKGPHDPSIGYPEHDRHKKVGELTSLVSNACKFAFVFPIFFFVYVVIIARTARQFRNAD